MSEASRAATAEPLAALAARVEQKLSASLLRRLAGAQQIDAHAHSVWYARYWWCHESALILGSAGVSHPLLALAVDEKGPTTFAAWMNTASPLTLGLGLAILLPWFFLRLYVKRERLDEVVPVYRTCKRELGDLESRLDDALASSDPLTAISPLIAEASEIVSRYYRAGNWPWQIGPDVPDDVDLRAKAHALVERHKDGWSVVPTVTGRKEAA